MNINLTAILFGLTFAFIVIELLRRKHLKEKYSFIWISFGIFVVGTAIFPNSLQGVSTNLGFQTFSNFVLAVLIFSIVLFVMQLSVEISQLEQDNQKLAEEIAILKSEK